METIKREALEESYGDMLKTESHHKHEIIRDERGIAKWKENPQVRETMKGEGVELGGLIKTLDTIGYGRNSEVLRKLYREMGVSLSSYETMFYDPCNNEEIEDYKQPPKELWEK
jgi:hypothetical protein